MNPEFVCILLSTVKTGGVLKRVISSILNKKKLFKKKYEGKKHSLNEVERKKWHMGKGKLAKV